MQFYTNTNILNKNLIEFKNWLLATVSENHSEKQMHPLLITIYGIWFLFITYFFFFFNFNSTFLRNEFVAIQFSGSFIKIIVDHNYYSIWIHFGFEMKIRRRRKKRRLQAMGACYIGPCNYNFFFFFYFVCVVRGEYAQQLLRNMHMTKNYSKQTGKNGLKIELRSYNYGGHHISTTYHIQLFFFYFFSFWKIIIYEQWKQLHK